MVLGTCNVPSFEEPGWFSGKDAAHGARTSSFVDAATSGCPPAALKGGRFFVKENRSFSTVYLLKNVLKLRKVYLTFNLKIIANLQPTYKNSTNYSC